MYTDEVKEQILETIKSSHVDKDIEKLFNSSMYPRHRVGPWRYVGLDKVNISNLSTSLDQQVDSQEIISQTCEKLGITSNNIILIHNGDLIHEHLTDGISITNRARKKDNCLLNNGRLNHWYTVLNQCLTSCTVDIKINPQQDVREPLYIIHSSDNKSDDNFITNNQVNIHVHNNSSISITEVYTTSENSNYLIQNPKSCYHLDKSAKCSHTVLHHHNDETVHFADINVQQADDSFYLSSIITAKGKINRTGINIQLSGERASSKVNALQWPTKTEKHDIYLNIDHLSPDTTSESLSKAVADNNGSASFTGNITVTSDAHFSQADLTNNNILLSETAKIFSRPELEIDNDEVKCSHGTTIGKLDSDMIFYLQSRGISLQEAKGILLQSFVSPVLEELETSGISSFIKDFFKDKINNER